MTNHSGYSRQGVAEEIQIAEDGSIRQAEATSCDLNGRPLEGVGKYPAYIACNLMGNSGELSEDGKRKMTPCITQEGGDRECGPEQFIHNMTDKCVAGYKYFNFRNTAKIALSLRGSAHGQIIVRLHEEGEKAAQLQIALSGGDWERVETEFRVCDEKSALYLEYIGEGYFDLRDIEFAI